jgi:hypothetical protein
MLQSLKRGAGVALAGVAAACASKPAAEAPPVVTITASDYSFSLPERIPAGPTTIRLVAKGHEIHHAVLVRLDEGKTVDDLTAALKNPGPAPTWAHPVGGPNPPMPGSETATTVTLTPGRYAAICMVPSADGVPHFAKGMIQAFEVTAAQSAAKEPTPDVTMKLADYAFGLSTPLQAGKRTIRVENAGPQLHEVALARLAPGKSLQDFIAWETGGEKGPPPVVLLGGVSPIEPGAAATFSADLTPGEYVLLCFIPDRGDGKPHLMHGMAQQLTIS